MGTGRVRGLYSLTVAIHFYSFYSLSFTAPENSSRKDWRTAGEDHWALQRWCSGLYTSWGCRRAASALPLLSRPKYLEFDFVLQSRHLEKVGRTRGGGHPARRMWKTESMDGLMELIKPLLRTEDRRTLWTCPERQWETCPNLESRFLLFFLMKKGLFIKPTTISFLLK